MKRYRVTVLAALLGALVVFVLLSPAGGNDSNPPECYSYFGYVVPCGFGPEQSQGVGFAARAAVIAALLVAAGSMAGHRDHDRAERPKPLS